ncbi:hypothetical protein AW072_26315 [Escherichia coli]|nr:hypothetical protein AW063_24060 [Escherichia coli]OTB96309.1 hypothetical protein AW072_26315 [Escherichia coli]TJQ27562.1 hypothetical protein C9Z64_23340 [Escherichia coli]
MQNGIAHNGLILPWRMREGKHLCPGKTTLSDHVVLYLPVSTFVGNIPVIPHISAGRTTPVRVRRQEQPCTWQRLW